MPDNRINKKMFLWNRVQNSSWAAELYAIFGEAKLQHVYRNNSPCSVNTIRKKLLSRFEYQWSNNVLVKPKLRAYIQIKHYYGTEFYAKANLTSWQV